MLAPQMVDDTTSCQRGYDQCSFLIFALSIKNTNSHFIHPAANNTLAYIIVRIKTMKFHNYESSGN